MPAVPNNNQTKPDKNETTESLLLAELLRKSCPECDKKRTGPCKCKEK